MRSGVRKNSPVVGQLLKQRREAQGLSRWELAGKLKKMGDSDSETIIAERTIARIEFGYSSPSLETVEVLTNILQLTAEEHAALIKTLKYVPGTDVQPSQVAAGSNRPPPEFATYLLWYLPKEIREVVVGDLEEEFYIVYDRFGRRKAAIWYYYQVGASFWPFAASAVRKFVKWGVFGWVGDLIRRVIT
jgi:transcriptional regulator with XRE-family HTH domain